MASPKTMPHPEMVGAEPLIEQEEVAGMLGVSRPTVRRLCDTQGLKSYEIGARLKFYRSEVLAWIASRGRVRKPADQPSGDSIAAPSPARRAGSPTLDRKAEAREMRRRRRARR